MSTKSYLGEIEPYLTEGLSYERYHEWQGVRSTELKRMTKSFQHFHYEHLHSQNADTPALRFGRLFHAAVLEPELFKQNFVIMPEFEGKTKEGKVSSRSAESSRLKSAWIESLGPTQVVVTPQEQTTLTGMLEAIMSHKAASVLLNKVPKELSLQWSEDGVMQKCRYDFVAPQGTPFDLKTTRDASPKAFEKEIFHRDRMYYLSAAHYCEGAKALNKSIKSDRFGFIAIEKEPPYGISITVLDHNALSLGKGERLRILKQFKNCVQTNNWPGYDENFSIAVPPSWMFPEEYGGGFDVS